MSNFLFTLPKPFFALAPMEDVTDTVFRRIIASCGKPDVFFTEFVSVDGLCSRGRERLLPHLIFSKEERPVMAQVWGLVPENFYKVSQEIKELGFDGIDINFGCPQRKIVKKGACAALIDNHQLAHEIILATKEGAGKLPVSVKTRLGYKKLQTVEWLGFLLEHDLAAITVHGRTASEQSAVPAHWDEIGKAVKLRDKMKKKTLIIGNGNVKSLAEARDKVEQYGVDGVMIGRGIFHNPWLFSAKQNSHIPKEKLELLLKHARLFEEVWGMGKPFNIMKKYFKIYVNGFAGASELRVKLMETHNLLQVETIIKEYLQ